METVTASSPDFAFLTYQSKSSQNPPEPELTVKREASWSYCGPLLANPESLPPNLQDWASAALAGAFLPALLPFLAFVNNFLAANGLDHYLLTIRATTANHLYDQPRWHTDDMFFSAGSGGLLSRATKNDKKTPLDLETNWKMCTTLLGPPTMFIPQQGQPEARKIQRAVKKAFSNDHPCTSIRCGGCAMAAEAVRNDLAVKLANFGAQQAPPGTCCFFRIGQDTGAVHSEPRMSDGGRIFVNVVPGKKSELGDLVSKWGMEFPRSWWIAPGTLRTETLS